MEVAANVCKGEGDAYGSDDPVNAALQRQEGVMANGMLTALPRRSPDLRLLQQTSGLTITRSVMNMTEVEGALLPGDIDGVDRYQDRHYLRWLQAADISQQSDAIHLAILVYEQLGIGCRRHPLDWIQIIGPRSRRLQVQVLQVPATFTSSPPE